MSNLNLIGPAEQSACDLHVTGSVNYYLPVGVLIFWGGGGLV